MTTTTHSKGPWQYVAAPKRYQNGSNTYSIYYSRSEDDIDFGVAEAYGAEANARLIAAAPQLLEALKALVSTLYPGFRLDDPRHVIFDAAKAAIAKAEGTV